MRYRVEWKNVFGDWLAYGNCWFLLFEIFLASRKASSPFALIAGELFAPKTTRFWQKFSCIVRPKMDQINRIISEIEKHPRWKHRNGNEYEVVCFTNVNTKDQERYPTTVVYKNVNNGALYSRPAVKWFKSMLPSTEMRRVIFRMTSNKGMDKILFASSMIEVLKQAEMSLEFTPDGSLVYRLHSPVIRNIETGEETVCGLGIDFTGYQPAWSSVHSGIPEGAKNEWLTAARFNHSLMEFMQYGDLYVLDR